MVPHSPNEKNVQGGKPKRRKRRPQSSTSAGGKLRRILQQDRTSSVGDGKGVHVMVFQECARSFLTLQSTTESIDDCFLNENVNNKAKDARTASACTTNTSDGDANATSVFFELANYPLIGYKIDDKMIVIRQENDCEIHTGGIVWETSYLLAEFLSKKYGAEENSLPPLGKTIEIGAGCGMLGLILATKGLSSKVVLTEASEVMSNLKENVEENIAESSPERNDKVEDGNTVYRQSIHATIYKPACPRNRVSVRQLRWDHLEEDIKAADSSDASGVNTCNELEPHSFDAIVGTDVVFSPSLVCPLLETISLMARKPSKSKKRNKRKNAPATLIYLCLQIRCADSHALLISEAPKYGLEVFDISEELNILNCAWGLCLECVMLKINVSSTKRKMSTLSSKNI